MNPLNALGWAIVALCIYGVMWAMKTLLGKPRDETLWTRSPMGNTLFGVIIFATLVVLLAVYLILI